MHYQLIQYLDETKIPRCGLVAAGKSWALPGESISAVFEDWEASHARLTSLADRLASGAASRPLLNLRDLRFTAPVPSTATIFGAGANYRDHVAAMARALNMKLLLDPRAEGVPPWHFIKPGRSTLAGHCQAIAIPAGVKRLDWEAELAVVIGKPARNVPESAALQFVAGYSCANDLSARDQLPRKQVDISSPFHFDWVGHKVFTGSCPIGPGFTPAEFVGSPEHLDIKLWLNGQLRQNSNTSNHIYSVAEQIAFLSSRFELNPGDVILTGTPAGVGMETGVFLAPWDLVRVEIEGLGTLENRFE